MLDFETRCSLTSTRNYWQRFLDGLSERFCHDTVSGCYIYLKAVFAEAVEQRMVTENPTKTLSHHTPASATLTLFHSKMYSLWKTPWRAETR